MICSIEENLNLVPLGFFGPVVFLLNQLHRHVHSNKIKRRISLRMCGSAALAEKKKTPPVLWMRAHTSADEVDAPVVDG